MASSSSSSLFAGAAPLQTTFDGAAVQWYPALRTTLKPRVVVLFICGNPGLVSFYSLFLATIHRHTRLRGRVEVIGVSHRGHAAVPGAAMLSEQHPTQEQRAADEARHGIRTSLYDQVRHKVNLLDALRRVYPRVHIKSTANGDNGGGEAGADGGDSRRVRSARDVKIVLIGHSIGAYIALEVMRARRKDVDGIHLLFPTLSHIARTPNAQSLRLLLHPLTATLLLPLPLLLLSLLPAILLIPLIRLLTAQPPPASQSTAELLLTRGAVINALAMARDEMRIVQALRPEIKEAVHAFVHRPPSEGGNGHIHAYWAKDELDGWSPSWLRNEVETELKLERVTLPIEREEVLRNQANEGRDADLPPSGGGGAPWQTPPPTLRSRSSSVHLGGSPRRRMSSSLLLLHSGLGAVSPGQDSSPGTGDAVINSPPSSMRLRKLSSAIAKRHIDGSITLERAVIDSDEEEEGEDGDGSGVGRIDHSDGKSAAGTRGVHAASVLGSLGVDQQAIVFEDPEPFSSEDEHELEAEAAARSRDTTLNANTNVNTTRGNGKHRSSTASTATPTNINNTDKSKSHKFGTASGGKLTSTICELGAPHAFCLRFGAQMGTIVAGWIREDYF